MAKAIFRVRGDVAGGGGAFMGRHSSREGAGYHPGVRSARLLAPALLATCLAGPAAAAGEGEAVVEWDPAVAFPHDRAAYEARLREIVRDAERLVAAETGMRLGRRLVVKVDGREAYERLFGAEAAGVEAAHYGREVVHLNGGSRLDDRFAGLVVHEMTHAFLDAGGTGMRVPMWLREGLAERLAWKRKGQVDLAPNQLAELKQARVEGRLVPLPVDGDMTRAAYLQCYGAVLFLERTAGKEKVLALVRRAIDGEPFPRALEAELRLTQVELERDYAAWVERR